MSATALKVTAASPWMRTEEAAAYIGSTPITLRGWRAQGRGPKYHNPRPRMVLYHRDDLDAFARGETAQ